jgi:hypothetical protein
METHTMNVIHTPKPERLSRRFRSGSVEVKQFIARRFTHRSLWKNRLPTHFEIKFPTTVKCFYNRVILYLGYFRRHFYLQAVISKR